MCLFPAQTTAVSSLRAGGNKGYISGVVTLKTTRTSDRRYLQKSKSTLLNWRRLRFVGSYILVATRSQTHLEEISQESPVRTKGWSKLLTLYPTRTFKPFNNVVASITGEFSNYWLNLFYFHGVRELRMNRKMHIQRRPSEIIVMLPMTKHPGMMKPCPTLCPKASLCLFAHFSCLKDNDLSTAGGHVRDLPSHFLLACQIESSYQHNPQKFRRVCEWEGRLSACICFMFCFFCVWYSNIMINCQFDSSFAPT